MNKPAPLLENETNKILWDFVIQKDNRILVGRPDLVLSDKKKITSY